MTSGNPARDATYFDRWYEDMSASPLPDAMRNPSLGLPPELLSTSSLTWQGISEVADALGLAPGGLLLDAACGRGGYGIEIARRTGARLLGIDFSGVALQQARSSSRQLPTGRAAFHVGTLLATGVADGQADALLCVDSIQFAEPPLAALVEFRRVLASGGRLAVTGWEQVDPTDRRVPARVRAVDLLRDLPAAGFVDVAVHDKPEWRQAERVMWQEVVAARADPDPAVRSSQDEGRRSLDTFDALRRVFATATAP